MEPESILGVMGGEPESMLQEPEFMLPELESMLSCENWVSPSPRNLDFGLGLDNKKTMCISFLSIKKETRKE